MKTYGNFNFRFWLTICLFVLLGIAQVKAQPSGSWDFTKRYTSTALQNPWGSTVLKPIADTYIVADGSGIYLYVRALSYTFSPSTFNSSYFYNSGWVSAGWTINQTLPLILNSGTGWVKLATWTAGRSSSVNTTIPGLEIYALYSKADGTIDNSNNGWERYIFTSTSITPSVQFSRNVDITFSFTNNTFSDINFSLTKSSDSSVVYTRTIPKLSTNSGIHATFTVSLTQDQQITIISNPLISGYDPIIVTTSNYIFTRNVTFGAEPVTHKYRITLLNYNTSAKNITALAGTNYSLGVLVAPAMINETVQPAVFDGIVPVPADDPRLTFAANDMTPLKVITLVSGDTTYYSVEISDNGTTTPSKSTTITGDTVITKNGDGTTTISEIPKTAPTSDTQVLTETPQGVNPYDPANASQLGTYAPVAPAPVGTINTTPVTSGTLNAPLKSDAFTGDSKETNSILASIKDDTAAQVKNINDNLKEKLSLTKNVEKYATAEGVQQATNRAQELSTAVKDSTASALNTLAVSNMPTGTGTSSNTMFTFHLPTQDITFDCNPFNHPTIGPIADWIRRILGATIVIMFFNYILGEVQKAIGQQLSVTNFRSATLDNALPPTLGGTVGPVVAIGGRLFLLTIVGAIFVTMPVAVLAALTGALPIVTLKTWTVADLAVPGVASSAFYYADRLLPMILLLSTPVYYMTVRIILVPTSFYFALIQKFMP
jgi:hypothetical protein